MNVHGSVVGHKDSHNAFTWIVTNSGMLKMPCRFILSLGVEKRACFFTYVAPQREPVRNGQRTARICRTLQKRVRLVVSKIKLLVPQTLPETINPDLS